jgi:hypothetical protein
MHGAGRRPATLQGRIESGQGQQRVEHVTDCVAYNLPRPRIEDHGEVHELPLEPQVGEVRDPELIGAVGEQIGKDRLLVRTVRRQDEAPAGPRRQGTFSHHPSDPYSGFVIRCTNRSLQRA